MNVVIYQESGEKSVCESELIEDRSLDQNGILRGRIEEAKFYIYHPNNPTTDVIFIFPGGGYSKLSMIKEGMDIAVDLCNRGAMSVVVQYPIYYGDYQRMLSQFYALQSKLFYDPLYRGIEQKNLHIIGFSAGGHFASMVAHHVGRAYGFGSLCYSTLGICYSVVSLSDTCRDVGCTKALLGESFDAEQARNISVEYLVGPKTPRSFVMYTEDDRRILPENSKRYITSLKENDIDHMVKVFEVGGHGFGLGYSDSLKWVDGYWQWINIL
ncbi:prolyl oligopeptidase family serine peptidase [Halosquirtibacter laminarini]|uniref:Prolyl oligopeptidase family serine peptidase n=1 Tax=Halosquirtibacter laminarini TaxID=3374600 RepID=A0AC61NL01_9BACT|nr:prolyl oligopeptidase family serine peptidase [Prolixibacteraceae bacterium]